MASNSWLQRQRKSELVEIAEALGLENYESLRKADLELSLDDYLARNAAALTFEPLVAGYFQSRAVRTRAESSYASPVKREPIMDEAENVIRVAKRVAKRRVTRASEEPSANIPDLSPLSAASSALVHTPARALALAHQIPLPATPADVAQAVDRGTAIVRHRFAKLYHESGVSETTDMMRDSLSTVTSLLLSVAAFEIWHLRQEVLPNRFAFTIPAVPVIGLSRGLSVYIPDMFLLLTASFWSPVFVWVLTTIALPSAFGYFFNLTTRTTQQRRRLDYAVDPLTFSIAKALLSYLVYAQGATLGGWLDMSSIIRIESAVYGGWKGILVGCAITGLATLYDAVLAGT